MLEHDVYIHMGYENENGSKSIVYIHICGTSNREV